MRIPKGSTAPPARLVFSLLVAGISWLATVDATSNAIPIVSKISGFATIRESSGASHELGSAEPLRSAATVTTAIDSLAVVNLDQVGKVQLGPQTKAVVSVRNGGLWFQTSGGSLCIVSQSQNVNVSAGALQISPAAAATIYDLLVRPSGIELAVFRGGVVVGGERTATTTVYAGDAMRADLSGKVSDASIASLLDDFSALKCPDPSVVSEVVHPASQPTTTNASPHGLTGIILGTLLGLGAIVAAASHGASSPSNTSQALNVSPTSLSFTNVGITLSASISETGYSGPFTESSNTCSGTALVSLASASGPTTTVNVTSQSAGTCRFDISDDHGQTATVNVMVGPFGGVQTNPSSVTTKVGSGSSQIQVSESGYSGTFSVSANACTGIASVSPPSGVSFSVSPNAVGNCALTFSDDHGQNAKTFVFVTAGTIMINPQTLQLTGAGDAQSFIASESSPAVFSATSSNLFVATVTLVNMTSNAATFNVTAVGNGKATIAVMDNLGGAGNVSVGVGQAPLIAKLRHSSASLGSPIAARSPTREHTESPIIENPVVAQLPRPRITASPPIVTFNAILESRAITVSESGYAGAMFVTSSTPDVATASISPGSNGLRVVTVTARRRGVTVIRVFDDRGTQITIPVIVAH